MEASLEAVKRARRRMASAESRCSDVSQSEIVNVRMGAVESGAGAETLRDPESYQSPACPSKTIRVKRRPFWWHRLAVSRNVRLAASYSVRLC